MRCRKGVVEPSHRVYWNAQSGDLPPIVRRGVCSVCARNFRKRKSCSRRPVLAEGPWFIDHELFSSSSSASAYLLCSSLLFPSLSSSYSIVQSSLGRITESSRDRPAVRHWDLTSSDRTLLYFRQKGGCRVFEALPTREPRILPLSQYLQSRSRGCSHPCFLRHCRGFRSNIDIFLLLGRILAHQAMSPSTTAEARSTIGPDNVNSTNSTNGLGDGASGVSRLNLKLPKVTARPMLK